MVDFPDKNHYNPLEWSRIDPTRGKYPFGSVL